jgi:hypothetical protein
MSNKGYGSIPGTLFECITFLARTLPVRSVPTFIELLIGAMLTQTRFVTGAWLAQSTRCGVGVPITNGSRRGSGPGGPDDPDGGDLLSPTGLVSDH